MNKLSIFGLLLAMAICTSCGGGGSNSGGGGGGGGSIAVSVVPTIATVALNQMQQFTATVTPSTTSQAVTWTLTPGNGTTCTAGSTCGTLSGSGVYMAPNALPGGNNTVVVTATSTADTSKSDSSTITLVSTQNSRVTGNYTFRFNGFNLLGPVLVIGKFTTDGNGTVTSGSMDMSDSSGPIGTLALTGTYSIGIAQNSNLGSMKLTSNAGDTFCYLFAVGSTTIDNPVFVEFGATTAPYINCNGAGRGANTHGSGLMNQAPGSSLPAKPFVFSLTGANLSQQRASYSGRFVSDGAGGITSWQFDENNAGTATTKNGSSGTYSIVGGRGTMVLTDASLNPVISFAFYVKDTNEVFMSVADLLTTNPRAAGAAESQDTTQAYDLSTFNGNTVFYTTGVGSSSTTGRVIVGRATTAGGGTVTAGIVDQNDAGSITTGANLTGSYTVSGSGRYTWTLNSVNYVMYAITKNKGFLQDSSTAVLNGLMEPQTGSLGNGTIAGTFVQTSQQVSTNGAQDAVAALTLNNGSISGTQNETDGTENQNQSVTGTYNVSTNGRGTYSLTPGVTTGFLYIVNPSRFVVIPMDTSNMNPTVLVTGR